MRRWLNSCAWYPDYVSTHEFAYITVKSGVFRGIENRQTLLKMNGKKTEAEAIHALAQKHAEMVQMLSEEPDIVEFEGLAFVSVLVWDADKKPIAGRRFGTQWCVIVYGDQVDDFLKALGVKHERRL